MSKNNTNSTIDEELIGKPYKGPIKLVWVDGRQIMQPDLEAISQGSPGSLQQQQSYFVGKTLDDIISETDEIQFSKLKTDSEKYDMVKGMITGVETNPIFKVCDGYYVNADGEYVNDGEYRMLRHILQDLIDKRKVWLNPKDGNLFEYTYAVANRMVQFPCQFCSKILFSDPERTNHAIHTHMAQRR